MIYLFNCEYVFSITINLNFVVLFLYCFFLILKNNTEEEISYSVNSKGILYLENTLVFYNTTDRIIKHISRPPIRKDLFRRNFEMDLFRESIWKGIISQTRAEETYFGKECGKA